MIIFFGGGVFTARISSLELLILVAYEVFCINSVHEQEHMTISTRIIKEKCFPELLSKFSINEYHDYIQIVDFKQSFTLSQISFELIGNIVLFLG